MGDFDKRITSLFNEHDNEIDKKKTERDREEEERKAYSAKVKEGCATLYEVIKPQIENLYSQLCSKNIKAIKRSEIIRENIFHLDFTYHDDRFLIEEKHVFCPRYHAGSPYSEIEKGVYYAGSEVITREMGIPFLPDYEPEGPVSKREDLEFENSEDFLEYISSVVERLLSEDLKNH